MSDEEREEPQASAEGQTDEEFKEDFEGDPATNPEEAKDKPGLPEGLRGG